MDKGKDRKKVIGYSGGDDVNLWSDKHLVAAQAAKKGGGHLAALSWQNLWLSSCVGLFMRTLCNRSLVFWN